MDQGMEFRFKSLLREIILGSLQRKKKEFSFYQMNEELQFHERFTTGDLLPNISYVFKVEAHNEAGFVSTSNVESEPHLISPTLGWFTIEKYFIPSGVIVLSSPLIFYHCYL